MIEAYNQANIFPILIDKIVEARDELEAFKAAILALEKQIPKRTVESDEYEYDEVCPKCGHKPFLDDNYCAKCGQALKIGEDEE